MLWFNPLMGASASGISHQRERDLRKAFNLASVNFSWLHCGVSPFFIEPLLVPPASAAAIFLSTSGCPVVSLEESKVFPRGALVSPLSPPRAAWVRFSSRRQDFSWEF